MTKPVLERKTVVPHTPFQRMVRAIVTDMGKSLHFKQDAMQCIQEASEEMLTELFLKADLARARGGRKTLHMDDIKFAKYITNDRVVLSEILASESSKTSEV
jgi:histone H3/H4